MPALKYLTKLKMCGPMYIHIKHVQHLACAFPMAVTYWQPQNVWTWLIDHKNLTEKIQWNVLPDTHVTLKLSYSCKCEAQWLHAKSERSRFHKQKDGHTSITLVIRQTSTSSYASDKCSSITFLLYIYIFFFF